MLTQTGPHYTANLNIDGFVKVLVLLDESLYTVQGVSLVIGSQESFSCCHPVLSLLTVTVKQLQRKQQKLIILEHD